MKVFIGSDHRGVDCKAAICKFLDINHFDYADFGAHEKEESCDYPQVAKKVATCVANAKNSRGVLICMSGIGQSIAANKVKGAYAALCYNPEAAKLSRQHNNANILVLSAKFTKKKELNQILKNWFFTEFEGGRHKRRFNQIKKIEKEQ